MIYNTGTIAGSGNTLTGTGTNFAAAGSLIRNGCTVIAMTSPPQVFQITGDPGRHALRNPSERQPERGRARTGHCRDVRYVPAVHERFC